MRRRAKRFYPQPMASGDDDKPGWLQRRMSILIGIAGLLAWFVMLWLMFGEVL